MPPAPAPPVDPILAWLDVLDDLTYYELFGVPAGASADDVRGAFHAFCDLFHPDRHLGRPPAERDAVSSIFKRGTEGFLVLSDAALRARYDAQIAADHPDSRRLALSPHAPRSSRYARSAGDAGGASGGRLEDAARSPSARPFARRAEELIQKGELRQAKLQLVMANYKDPANDELAAALRDLEAKLAARTDPR